jgi:hypothetical protein
MPSVRTILPLILVAFLDSSAVAQNAITSVTDHSVCSDRQYLVRTISQTRFGDGYDELARRFDKIRVDFSNLRPSKELSRENIDYAAQMIEMTAAAFFGGFRFDDASWLQEIPASSVSGVGSRCRATLTFGLHKLYVDLSKLKNATFVAAQNNPEVSETARWLGRLIGDILETFDGKQNVETGSIRLVFHVFNDTSNQPVVHVIDRREF